MSHPTDHGRPSGWHPTVAARLDEALASAQPGDYIALDFDNTCLWRDIGESFLRDQLRHGRLATTTEAFWSIWEDEEVAPARALADAAAGRAPEDPAVHAWAAHVWAAYEARCAREGKGVGYGWAVQLMAGMEEAQVMAHAAAHVQRALGLPAEHEDAVRVHVPVRAYMQRCQEAGVAVWIVSASSWWIVQAGAAVFGVAPEQVCGNRVLVEQGRLTATAAPPQLVFAGKVEALRQARGDEHPPLLMFGDSMTDSDVMRWASCGGVVIDRGVAPLRTLAHEQGWVVQPREHLAHADS